MPSVSVVIVGLDVADAAVIVLKLTLHDKVGVIGSRQIKVVVAGDLAIERDLKVLVAGLSDRNVLGVEFQWGASLQCLSFGPNSTPIARRPTWRQRLRVYRVSIGVAGAITVIEKIR